MVSIHRNAFERSKRAVCFFSHFLSGELSSKAQPGGLAGAANGITYAAEWRLRSGARAKISGKLSWRLEQGHN
jgi:hypothetical protein